MNVGKTEAQGNENARKTDKTEATIMSFDFEYIVHCYWFLLVFSLLLLSSSSSFVFLPFLSSSLSLCAVAQKENVTVKLNLQPNKR